ncbi:MAG TPA: sodium:calcium antiporter, partial [Spirochaetia bacterium]|nr:sodium:calcium antiporter [Spirochaetia bacterium]
MLNFLLLMVSFAPLLYGANLLVDSASSLAKKLNIPNIVIGLTVVAFGTSSPELVVNVFASATGNSTITIGNVIGSNILNVLVILGISAIIYPLTVKSATTWIEIPLSLMAAAAVLVVANDPLIDQAAAPVIGRVDGIMLLLLFIV